MSQSLGGILRPGTLPCWRWGLSNRWMACLLVLVIAELLKGARGECADQTFDSVCICLGDDVCTSTATALSSNQNCTCQSEGAMPLSIEAFRNELKLSREYNHVYVSGLNITSLAPLASWRQSSRLPPNLAVVVKNTSVTSLDPLDGLSSLTTLAIVANGNLKNLSGLRNLVSVNGRLIIWENNALENLDSGLGALKKVGGFLIVGSNPVLANISGFDSLEMVGDALYIDNNRLLQDIDGFHKLSKVENSLRIGGNRRLTNINGFNALESCAELNIVNNDALVEISGFGKIGSVFNLSVNSNRALSRIGGFRGLQIVAGDLSFDGNDALEDIDGLNHLEEVQGAMTISSNGALLAAASQFNRFSAMEEDENKHRPVFSARSIDEADPPHAPPEELESILDSTSVPTSAHISGMLQLATVGGDLKISGNRALVDITGLRNLATVSGSLVIDSNNDLARIPGFGNLSAVYKDLKISSNRDLSDAVGLSGLHEVGRNLRIFNNSALPDVNWLAGLSVVKGSLVIRSNEHMGNVLGLQNLRRVHEKLVIQSCAALPALTGFDSLLSVGRNMFIKENLRLRRLGSFRKLANVGGSFVVAGKNASLDMSDGLESLRLIEGDLVVRGVCFVGGEFAKLEKVGGNVTIEGSQFKNVSNIFRQLSTVGESLSMDSNVIKADGESGALDIFRNVRNISCHNGRASKCGLIIKGNMGYKTINSFGNLALLNGTLRISDNRDLEEVTDFSSLSVLAPHKTAEATAADLFIRSGGLIIHGNPQLRHVGGFDSLQTVDGVFAIFNNTKLKYISFRQLTRVASFTRIEHSTGRLNFSSVQPLPSREEGCRRWRNAVPHRDTSDGTGLATNLVKDVCNVEKLLPTLVGIGIIGSMVVVSLFLLLYMIKNFYSPLRPRVGKGKLKEMFAGHLLALGDVLSDVGFVVTVFILWDTKGGEVFDDLFVIGISSIAVLAVSQSFIVVATYFGLRSKKIAEGIGLVRDDGRPMSLLQHLKDQEGVHWGDWIVLFPGLLVLDAEIIKHLPWGAEVTGSGNREAHDGFPHRYFSDTAFAAGLLEDLPQIVLQVIFMVVIEEDDGWVITGAMASLTLSVADVMVKIVFPVLARLCVRREAHLTHQPGRKWRNLISFRHGRGENIGKATTRPGQLELSDVQVFQIDARGTDERAVLIQ